MDVQANIIYSPENLIGFLEKENYEIMNRIYTASYAAEEDNKGTKSDLIRNTLCEICKQGNLDQVKKAYAKCMQIFADSPSLSVLKDFLPLALVHIVIEYRFDPNKRLSPLASVISNMRYTEFSTTREEVVGFLRAKGAEEELHSLEKARLMDWTQNKDGDFWTRTVVRQSMLS